MLEDRCFDLSRCCQNFTVYIYPHQGAERNEWADAIDEIASTAPYVTSEPHSACVLFPNLGAFQCCKVSRAAVAEELQSLPYWQGTGRNHAVLDYRDWYWQDKLRDWASYDIGDALALKSSMPTYGIREGYDVSLPFPRRTFPQPLRRDLSRKQLLAVWMGSASESEGEPPIRRHVAQLHDVDAGVIALDTSRMYAAKTVTDIVALLSAVAQQRDAALSWQVRRSVCLPVRVPRCCPITTR